MEVFRPLNVYAVLSSAYNHRLWGRPQSVVCSMLFHCMCSSCNVGDKTLSRNAHSWRTIALGSSGECIECMYNTLTQTKCLNSRASLQLGQSAYSGLGYCCCHYTCIGDCVAPSLLLYAFGCHRSSPGSAPSGCSHQLKSLTPTKRQNQFLLVPATGKKINGLWYGIHGANMSCKCTM